jgi:drug/metabolite transporter (DMT)-like permease
MLMLYLAIGLAGDRQQVLEVGLLNYLWPALTLVLSPVFLHKKANWLLIPGTALALIGVLLVLTQGARISWQSVSRNVVANPLTYALALGAAVSWATYSNLARRWAGGEREGAVALFLPTTGVVLVAISLFVDESRTWSYRTLVEALFLGIASYIAYGLWDNAMRKGNVTVVAAASYLTPFFSIIVSQLYLAVMPDRQLWIGCALLILGSILSRRSVSDIASPGASQATIDQGSS